jgi:site-specific DNA recombinase
VAVTGEWIGGKTPFGYSLDSATKTLVIHEDEAAVVRRVFARHIEDRLGPTGIATWLNDTGQRTR